MEITDDFLQHFLILKEEHGSLGKKLEEMRQMIIFNGSCVTTAYLCVVEEQERTSVKPLAEIYAILSPAIVQQYSLTKTTKYKIIRVVPRQQAV